MSLTQREVIEDGFELSGNPGVLWKAMSSFRTAGGGTQVIRLSCSALGPDQIYEGACCLAALIGDVRP